MSLNGRWASKGYVYQHHIFEMFVSKMDVSNNINFIEADKIMSKGDNFDDCYIETDDDIFYFQVKNVGNNKKPSLDDINVYDKYVKLFNQKIFYNPNHNNILILYTDEIECNTTILDLNAYFLKGIYIVPLTTEEVNDIISNLFYKVERERLISNFAYGIIEKNIFKVSKSDLPPLKKFSVNLEEETIILRNVVHDLDEGILHYIGKPGIGKSHFVNEIKDKIQLDVLYRFSISPNDKDKISRLNYDEFLADMGVSVFKSPKYFDEDDLIDEINKNKLRIVIDGLDHVENYNPIEFEKFVEFINKIKHARVIVLSRPLKNNLPWKTELLKNWNYEQLNIYLSKSYKIKCDEVIDKIYNISEGYPIISMYLAKEYKLNGEIANYEDISEVDDYYRKLISNNDKLLFQVFLLNDYYILEDELSLFLGIDSFCYVKDFINKHPYLFNRNLNRVSLIHDSFNTFLKKDNTNYIKFEKDKLEIVKKSIDSGDIRFLSRFNGFNFDNNYKKSILIKYSNIEFFESIYCNYVDFESLSEFYFQLHELLSNSSPNILDIYQYYSFILIMLILNRNNLTYEYTLLYQNCLYFDKYNEIIFSKTNLWEMYQYFHSDIFSRSDLLNSDNSNINHIKKAIFDEDLKIAILCNELDIKKLNKSLEKSYKYEVLEYLPFILASIKIHNNYEYKEYLEIIDEYLKYGFYYIKSKAILTFEKFNLDEYYLEMVMNNLNKVLSNLGFFDNDGMFLNTDLKMIIEDNAPRGSFEVSYCVENYIRFNLYCDNEFNINDLNMFYTMYAARKDYTVIKITDALITFENHGLLNEETSINIIINLMNQSEKGINHLLNDYINKKDVNFINRFIDNYDIGLNDIFGLNCNVLNKLPFEYLWVELDSLTSFGKFEYIDYYEISNSFYSVYKDKIINFLKKHKIKIINVPKNEISIFEGNVDFTIKEEFDYNHIPLKDYLSLEDLDYVIENNISPLELSKYVNGFYYAFPYLEFYEHYDKDYLKLNCLNIFHNVISIRFSNHFADLSYLLGYLPNFLDMIDYDVKWEKLYQLFVIFLKISLIKHDFNK